ncbi:hypothetical protein QQ045_011377 [Rhodiola kirilowii]
MSIENEVFKFYVLPSNQPPVISSPEFIIIGISADITLVTVSDDFDEEIEYESDLDYLTDKRFLYEKDLKLGREEFLLNEKASRTTLVDVLTCMEVPERYHKEIVDGIFCFVMDDIEFSPVAVDIEIVRYDDEGEDGDDEMDDVIEPSFRMVAVDEKMRAENENCAICMDGYPVGSEVCKLKCHHFYHRRCLLKWLGKSVTCPICRKPPPNFCVAPPEPTGS